MHRLGHGRERDRQVQDAVEQRVLPLVVVHYLGARVPGLRVVGKINGSQEPFIHMRHGCQHGAGRPAGWARSGQRLRIRGRIKAKPRGNDTHLCRLPTSPTSAAAYRCPGCTQTLAYIPQPRPPPRRDQHSCLTAAGCNGVCVPDLEPDGVPEQPLVPLLPVHDGGGHAHQQLRHLWKTGTHHRRRSVPCTLPEDQTSS